MPVVNWRQPSRDEGKGVNVLSETLTVVSDVIRGNGSVAVCTFDELREAINTEMCQLFMEDRLNLLIRDLRKLVPETMTPEFWNEISGSLMKILVTERGVKLHQSQAA